MEKEVIKPKIRVRNFSKETITNSVLQSETAPETQAEAPQASLRVFRRLSQPPPHTVLDHDYARPSSAHGLPMASTSSSSGSVQISVKVEQLDEDRLRNQRKRKPSPFKCFTFDYDQMFAFTNLIHEKTKDPVDKYLSVQMKNVWGRVFRYWDDNDPYEALIRTALQMWSLSVSKNKFKQEIPLFYQCQICYLAWWFLQPFRDHIRTHNILDLKVNFLETHCDSFIVANNQTSWTPMYITCPGNCYLCGETFTSHFKTNQRFVCSTCKMSFPNCLVLFRHKPKCGMKVYRYRCHVCLIPLYSHSIWETHLRTSHVARSDIPVPVVLSVCGYCRRSYTEHDTHFCSFKSQECSYCSRKFANINMMRLHLEGQRSDVICEVCGDILAKACMKTQHMLTHTGNFKMVYKCSEPGCEQNVLYMNSIAVRNHRNRHEKTTGLWKFFFDRVIVPTQCIEPDHNPFNNNKKKALPSSAAPVSSKHTDTVHGKYQVFGNIILKEELQDLEPRKEPDYDSDQGAMGYAEMLSRVFNISNEPSQEPATKTDSSTKKQKNSKNSSDCPTFVKILPKPKEKPKTYSKSKYLSELVKILPNPQPLTINVPSVTTLSEPSTKETSNAQPSNLQTAVPNNCSDGQKSRASKTPQSKPVSQPKTSDIQPTTSKFQPVIQSTVTIASKDPQTTPQARNPNTRPASPKDVPEKEMITEIKMEPMDFETFIDDPITIKSEPIEACFETSFDEALNDNMQNDITTDNELMSRLVNDQNDNRQSSSTNNDSKKGDNQNDSCPNIVIQNDNLGNMIVTIKGEPCDPESNEQVEKGEITVEDFLAVKMEPEDVKQELMQNFNIDLSNVQPRAGKVKQRQIKIKKKQKITTLSSSGTGLKVKKIVKKDEQIIKMVEKEVGEGTEPTVVTRICVDDRPPKRTKVKHKTSNRRAKRKRAIQFDEKGNVVKKMYRCHKCGYEQIHKLFMLHKKSNCEIKPTDQYKCTKCASSYDTFKKFLSHFTQHGHELCQCPICGVTKETMIEFVSHFHHHIRSNFLVYWENETDNPHGKRHKCRQCDKIVKPKEFFDHFEKHLKLGALMSDDGSDATESTSASKKGPKKRFITDVDLAALELTPDVMVSNTRRLKSDALQVAIAQLRYESQIRDCRLCGRIFSRRNDIKRHMVEHLLGDAYSKKDTTPKRAFRCQICQSDFFQVQGYKLHMRDHGSLPVYKCELCDKTFSDSSNFAKHMKIHNNMRVVICDICGKKFHTKATIEKHMIMHMTTEPIYCKLCNKKFYENSTYKKHFRTVHKRKIMNFPCLQCVGVNFTMLRQKWDHMWEVHGERNVQADCSICNARFRKIQQLKQHIKAEH